jgi:hypothetical protein
VQIPWFESGTAQIVDISTGENEWRTEQFSGSTVDVTEWATIVLTGEWDLSILKENKVHIWGFLEAPDPY